MNIKIKELTKENLNEYNVTNFLFKMIKQEYHMTYVPSYHKDIINLENYYINPERNNFFLAIDTDKNKLVGTSAIRGYDRKDYIKGKTYSRNSTASLYRVFIHPMYRRYKIATKLVNYVEEFCANVGYNEIYLHTQKTVSGALSFWLYNNYQITQDMNNNLGTVHMEKIIASK